MINPPILRTAREALALTQVELAERTGLPQADISRWERGLRTPSRAQVRQLADALWVPPELLTSSIRSSRPVHRTARVGSKRSVRTVDARIELARLAASQLLEDIEFEVPFRFPTFDDPLPSDPEVAAHTVRRVWRIPDGPISNLSAYIEAAGAIVLPVNFDTDSILAAYADVPNDHRWLFTNERAIDPARLRFSLAHEVGHAILHWDRFDVPYGQTAEREAHRFAAALLMPPAEMASVFSSRRTSPSDLVEMRSVWGVSIQALVMRAAELGLVSPQQKTRLFQQLSTRGWRTAEPGEVPPEEPSLFAEAIRVHEAEHRFSPQELASLCGLDPERLGDLLPRYFESPSSRSKPRLRLVGQ